MLFELVHIQKIERFEMKDNRVTPCTTADCPKMQICKLATSHLNYGWDFSKDHNECERFELDDEAYKEFGFNEIKTMHEEFKMFWSKTPSLF